MFGKKKNSPLKDEAKDMKKQKENHLITDINCFDEEASIYKILFQDRATALLKYIIDKISIDKYENVNYRLPSILIAGKEVGKQLIARAFTNSICANFEHIQGKNLGMGGYCGSLYENSDKETVYYISSADKLSPYSVSLLLQYLRQGFVAFKSQMTGENKIVSSENKLFIFSADDSKKLCPDLFRAIDYHCYLQNYTVQQMEIIVEQRLKWSGSDFDKEVPAIIVHNSRGSISNCMRLLSLCYLVMRGNGRNKMTAKDIEIGIGLSRQEGTVPAHKDVDMPF